MSAGNGSLSMDGRGGGKDGNGLIVLPNSIPANWIYPVASVPTPPRSGIVVSAGPVGGGGLRVYGVLRGSRISTTYLSMPHKNWILQYSSAADVDIAPVHGSGQVIATLGESLPSPWAEKKFDFRRPTIPPEKLNQMIILHGHIQEDGTIDGLKVYQGVQPDADQIALAAFSQWKFRPATRRGKPIRLEILVGIPVAGAGAEETAPMEPDARHSK